MVNRGTPACTFRTSRGGVAFADCTSETGGFVRCINRGEITELVPKASKGRADNQLAVQCGAPKPFQCHALVPTPLFPYPSTLKATSQVRLHYSNTPPNTVQCSPYHAHSQSVCSQIITICLTINSTGQVHCQKG